MKKKIAIELALQNETNKFLGWDIALTPKGWIVVEGNVCGFILSQATRNVNLVNRIQCLRRVKIGIYKEDQQ